MAKYSVIKKKSSSWLLKIICIFPLYNDIFMIK